MSHNTKTGKKGFSLLELIVGIAIISVVSLVSVRIVYDTVTSRSIQLAREGASQQTRLITQLLTEAIQSADLINIPTQTELQITGAPCKTIRFNLTNASLEQAIDSNSGCTPPFTSFSRLSDGRIKIKSFALSPTATNPLVINVIMEGNYKQAFDNYPFRLEIAITSRVSL